MKLVADEFRRKYPGGIMGPKDSFSVQPLQDAIVSDVRTSLWVLIGAVTLALLIACANVANLPRSARPAVSAKLQFGRR